MHPLQQRRDKQDRLHKVMLQARDDWEKASAELAQVMRDRESLLSSDGVQALRNAKNGHRLALDKYKASLKEFADLVLSRGPEAGL